MSDAKPAFRLNLQQQRKRAKELLKAVKAGDDAARARLATHGGTRNPQQIQLADAQRIIARELGFNAWNALKAHTDSLDRALAAIQRRAAPPDADQRTLHVRCGSDIQRTLEDAGFSGEFLEVSYPYCHGPVSRAPDHLEIEARFIAEFAAPLMAVSFEAALQHRRREELALAESTSGAARIVLWMEHDCFDQLVLLRCLSHYASLQSLPRLELIDVEHFPGTTRFLGLGQLPAEALRLLWDQRRPVERAQLALAQAFAALCSEDPRPLAALMRAGSTELPHLPRALERLLQELPWVEDGLSLTERLILQQLARGAASFQQTFSVLQLQLDPLPFATDLKFLSIIDALQQLSPPLVVVTPSAEHWRHHRLQITDKARAVLRHECDAQSLHARARWVGGARVSAGAESWRWDDTRRDAVRC